MRPVPSRDATYEETLDVTQERDVIQVDFDGTLVLWDYSMDKYTINETIKKYLIKKSTNCTIYVCTARGSLSRPSCGQSNRKLAHEHFYKYYHDILTRAGVPFDVLSFNKVLATEYIDDNAINSNDTKWLRTIER